MELVRQYKNASGDDLRIDTIVMQRKQNTIASKADTHTFLRILKKRLVYSTAVADRDVAVIEIIGDFDNFDTSNYDWATWDSPSARCDMSDLPNVGETI